jgi:glucan phosphoethanolaminetransferase (alkaline phosphatase superfamily)
LLVEWIIARGKDVQWFFWTTCLTLTVTQLAGIPIDLAEQFILVIPLMLILSVWVQRTKILGQRIMLGSMIGLFAVPWYLAYKAGFENHLETPGISIFFIVPLIILVGVLWIRWWAVRPMRLYIEELRGNEGG